MADAGALIDLGPSERVDNGGPGIRFDLRIGTSAATGFAIRHDGRVHGYLNQCAHVAMELDWLPGVFFDSDGTLLVCASHGALYDPANGRCAAGPCLGRGRLRPLDVFESKGRIYWRPDGLVRPPGP